MHKMIDTTDLLTFLTQIEGGTVAVDLLKIGQSSYHPSTGNNANSKNNKYNTGKFRLALDVEDCLDRFYGGYYSDWACGGQWNRAYQFVQLLANAFNMAHIEVIAFFDGTLREYKKQSFERNVYRQKCVSVLKHIRMIGTPPPKIWWLPPSGIRTCLRNAMRNLNIQVVQTVSDHTMEVIEYYHEHKLNGILGLHPDYIIANTTRYFSSHDLRLSYKGSLETKEYLVSKLLSSLSLTPDHLPFIAVFLGGYILLDEPTIKIIYQKIGLSVGTTDFDGRIKRLAEIIRNSPTNDLDEFIKHLNLAEWASQIKESVEYYQRKGKFSGKQYLNHRKITTTTTTTTITTTKLISSSDINVKTNLDDHNDAIKASILDGATPLASETSEHDEFARKLLNDVSSLVDDGDIGDDDDDDDEIDDENIEEVNGLTDGVANIVINEQQSNSTVDGVAKTTATTTTTTTTTTGSNGNEVTSGTGKKESSKKQTNVNKVKINNRMSTTTTFIYTLPVEVLKTALNRHQRGIMDPKIYQLLTKKEITLPQILEDEQYREIPSVHLFYRPARQMIYAILFNLYHQKYLCSKKQDKDHAPKHPEIIIYEWIWSPQNEYVKSDLVNATLLPWAVPTIQRLWFGTVFEDKQRRMKAFLSVMRSDSPLMLNRGYVPQHMLTMACVLRYIVTSPDGNILTRQELDAFLATAFSPHFINIEYTQELVLPGVNLRGVYLATLFMQGVETASLANDACGVPLPWTMTNPWLFFDGKLFHLKLKMSTYVQSLRELCDDHIEIVLKIERFRKAILEDVEHFLLPPHMDPLYRATNFMPSVSLAAAAQQQQQGGGGSGGYGKNSVHPLTNIPLANGTTYYNASGSHISQQSITQQSAYYANGPGGLNTNTGGHNNITSGGNNIRNSNRGGGGVSGGGGRRINNNNIQQQLVRQLSQRQNGYQLKVGGVVVGSWAGGVTQKPLGNGGGSGGGGGASGGGIGIGGNSNIRFNRAAGILNQRRRGGSGLPPAILNSIRHHNNTIGGGTHNNHNQHHHHHHHQQHHQHHHHQHHYQRLHHPILVDGGCDRNNSSAGGMGCACGNLRFVSRNTYGVSSKVNKNRTRKNRLKEKKTVTIVTPAEAAAEQQIAENINKTAGETGKIEDKVILKKNDSTDSVVSSSSTAITTTVTTVAATVTDKKTDIAAGCDNLLNGTITAVANDKKPNTESSPSKNAPQAANTNVAAPITAKENSTPSEQQVPVADKAATTITTTAVVVIVKDQLQSPIKPNIATGEPKINDSSIKSNGNIVSGGNTGKLNKKQPINKKVVNLSDTVEILESSTDNEVLNTTTVVTESTKSSSSSSSPSPVVVQQPSPSPQQQQNDVAIKV